jgi:hypothetical protein
MAPGGWLSLADCPLLAVPYRWLPPAIALQGHSAAFDGQSGGEPGSINPGETPAGTVPLDWDQAGPTLASDQNDQAVGLSWCTMPKIAASLAMGA